MLMLNIPQSCTIYIMNIVYWWKKIKVKKEMLSPFQRELKESLNIKDDTVNKLVPNLYDKKNYKVHYKLLQFAINKGLIVERINGGYSFDQSTFMADYINFNIHQRKNATLDFERAFFKLLNNSVFGKSMENVRNRVNIKFVFSDDRKHQKLASKFNYKRSFAFNADLRAVELAKTTVTLDKSIYVGAAILDLSKLHMYRFHYDYIKNKYDDKASLLFTDTDSLCYHIETEDVYKDMQENIEEFDTSNYPKNHFIYSTDRADVIGKFKDEAKGKIIREFVGLAPKMYSVKFDDETEIKKAKGIKSAVVKKKINFNHYKEQIFDENIYKTRNYQDMQGFRSYGHAIYTIKQHKAGISAYDTKRYILNDNINTLAFGHKNIISSVA